MIYTHVLQKNTFSVKNPLIKIHQNIKKDLGSFIHTNTQGPNKVGVPKLQP